jgi:hypothetical protein
MRKYWALKAEIFILKDFAIRVMSRLLKTGLVVLQQFPQSRQSVRSNAALWAT